MPAPFEISPEHHLRELLNMIMLLERCLALPDSTPHERDGWRDELVAARQRLADLLTAARTSGRLTRHLVTSAPAVHLVHLDRFSPLLAVVNPRAIHRAIRA